MSAAHDSVLDHGASRPFGFGRDALAGLAFRMRSSTVVRALAAFVLSAAGLAYVQFASPHLVDPDGYYHLRMAALIREQGVPVAFPWLPLTILDPAHFTDHHLLLHVLQAPFTLLADQALAGKLAAVAFAALALTTFVLVLTWHGVRFPLLWMVLLFASASPFLFRMSMARGQSLSVALQLLTFHMLMRRSPVGLAIVSAVFVWTYNAFPILVPLVAVGILAHAITRHRLEYRLALGAAAGIGFALVVNPYFPSNVLFLWNHIAPKILVADYATSVGTEWLPYSSWALVTLLPGAAVAYLLALALTNREEWGRDTDRLFWALTATLYLVLLLKSRRFVEYFPPAALLALAFTLKEPLARLDLRRIEWTEGRLALAVCAGIAVASMLQMTLMAAREEVRGQPSTARYQGGARWLASHTPAGSRVFHTDWDDFPPLFFFNTHNTYLVGLDPDFMRLRDPRRYDRWVAVTRGEVADPGPVIADEFESAWAFTDNEHTEFIAHADRSPRMERAYVDDDVTIYRVRAP